MPFWKDKISENMIIEIVIQIFWDLVCKIVNLIYALKDRKKNTIILLMIEWKKKEIFAPFSCPLNKLYEAYLVP